MEPLVLKPFVSVGPYRFGMTADEAASALGPPDRVVDNAPMNVVEIHRGPVEARFSAKDGRLVLLTFRKGSSVSFGGHDFFADPAAAIAALGEADPTAEVRRHFRVFPGLGVCMSGVAKRPPKNGRELTAYARSERWYMQHFGNV